MSYKARLVDITKIQTGKLDSNAAVENGEYPFFTCSQQTLRIDCPAYDTEAVLLGGNNASGVFPLKYYHGQFNAYQRTYILETLDSNILNTRYLFYALRPALSHFQTVSIGAATQYLTKGILNSFRLVLPPIREQFSVVSILSAYDDMIENNRRRIQLLEESARLVYKEWFVRLRFPGHEHVKIVDGVPEGWERRCLGEIATIKKGKNITKEIVEEGEVPVIAGGLKPAYYHSMPNAFAPVITISASGANAGYIALYHRDIWASDCSYLSRTDNPEIWFLYLALKSRQTEITGMQQGSAQPHVYPKQLERIIISYPSAKLRNLFSESVDACFQQINNLEKQIDTLAKARDLLLPRLMNGEIAV